MHTQMIAPSTTRPDMPLIDGGFTVSAVCDADYMRLSDNRRRADYSARITERDMLLSPLYCSVYDMPKRAITEVIRLNNGGYRVLLLIDEIICIGDIVKRVSDIDRQLMIAANYAMEEYGVRIAAEYRTPVRWADSVFCGEANIGIEFVKDAGYPESNQG